MTSSQFLVCAVAYAVTTEVHVTQRQVVDTETQMQSAVELAQTVVDMPKVSTQERPVEEPQMHGAQLATEVELDPSRAEFLRGVRAAMHRARLAREQWRFMGQRLMRLHRAPLRRALARLRPLL